MRTYPRQKCITIMSEVKSISISFVLMSLEVTVSSHHLRKAGRAHNHDLTLRLGVLEKGPITGLLRSPAAYCIHNKEQRGQVRTLTSVVHTVTCPNTCLNCHHH